MGVEFEENNFNRNDFGATKTPKFAEWLISKGIAKDVEGANKIQIGIAILFFALSLFFFLK